MLCPRNLYDLQDIKELKKDRKVIGEEGIDFIFQQNRENPADGRIYC
jgi:hypothetical protein